jgi:FAD/FMN-containing dehydrogenase
MSGWWAEREMQGERRAKQRKLDEEAEDRCLHDALQEALQQTLGMPPGRVHQQNPGGDERPDADHVWGPQFLAVNVADDPAHTEDEGEVSEAETLDSEVRDRMQEQGQEVLDRFEAATEKPKPKVVPTFKAVAVWSRWDDAKGRCIIGKKADDPAPAEAWTKVFIGTKVCGTNVMIFGRGNVHTPLSANELRTHAKALNDIADSMSIGELIPGKSSSSANAGIPNLD